MSPKLKNLIKRLLMPFNILKYVQINLGEKSEKNQDKKVKESKYKTLTQRIFRHSKSLKFLTIPRFFNLFQLILDIKLRNSLVSSLPIFARINPCSVCNISCPGCSIYDDKQGIKKYIRPKQLMTIEIFKKIINPLKNSLLEVVLYDEGEPLLNNNIWEMVRYAKLNKIRTVISTNISFTMSDNQISELFNSGLDYLIVAIDGMTQETYQLHRQGGNLDLVKNNFERIMNYKRLNPKNAKTEIEVQFIEFPYNIHEKDAVIEYAKKWDADVINSFASYSKELSDVAALKGRGRKHFGCFDLYAIADFDVDGSLYSCDFQEDLDADSVGNINSKNFIDIWNDEKLQVLRNSFSKNSSDDLDKICAKCPVTRGLPAPLI